MTKEERFLSDTQDYLKKEDAYKLTLIFRSQDSPAPFHTPILFDGMFFRKAREGDARAVEALKEQLYRAVMNLDKSAAALRESVSKEKTE